MAMRWHDLLFAHWPVPADRLRPFVPDELVIDTFDGTAWLGVVPFRMSGVRARCTPALPGVGAFPELNLRTYVRHGGHAGVWFFSLDAASRLAVRAARASFRLPYFDARMSCTPHGDRIRYRSDRVHRGVAGARFVGEYGPIGAPFAAASGSLEHFLTERYCLFTTGRDGGPRRGDIDHVPWPLQPADWAVETIDMTRLVDVTLDGPPASLLFARSLDVRAWLPVRSGAARS